MKESMMRDDEKPLGPFGRVVFNVLVGVIAPGMLIGALFCLVAMTRNVYNDWPNEISTQRIYTRG